LATDLAAAAVSGAGHEMRHARKPSRAGCISCGRRVGRLDRPFHLFVHADGDRVESCYSTPQLCARSSRCAARSTDVSAISRPTPKGAPNRTRSDLCPLRTGAGIWPRRLSFLDLFTSQFGACASGLTPFAAPPKPKGLGLYSPTKLTSHTSQTGHASRGRLFCGQTGHGQAGHASRGRLFCVRRKEWRTGHASWRTGHASRGRLFCL
jgi:hypothetical protein